MRHTSSAAHRLPQQQHQRPPAALPKLLNLGGLFGGGGTNSSSSTPRVRPADYLDLGGLRVSPLGLGTWAWGNQFLWGYDTSMDAELQEVFNLVVDAGVNVRCVCVCAHTACQHQHQPARGTHKKLARLLLQRNHSRPLCTPPRPPFPCVHATPACLRPQIFDTADSYGTGALNGRSEQLLGQFIR